MPTLTLECPAIEVSHQHQSDVYQTHQTNCFVASLNQPVSYELRLFNDTTGAQIGGTLAGSLQPFQQFRYLNVFNGKDGMDAPPVDQTNVREQFTQTSGGSANLIAF